MHISPRTSLRLAGTIAATAVLAINSFATSANASARSTAVHAYKDCILKILPVQPHQRFSRVVSSTCSVRYAAGTSNVPAVPQETDPYAVISLYSNQYWTGDIMQIDGVSGGCSSGVEYYIADSQPSSRGYGNWNIESWIAHNSCWHTTIYYGTNFGGPEYTYAQGVWEAGQIGSPWDQHVYSIWTRYS
jgi:hypothetical protein